MRGYSEFLWRNRRFLGFGMLLCFASSFGQTFFISLFSGEIRTAYGLSHGAFGAVYAAGTLTSAAILVWSGRLIDRVDLRIYLSCVVAGLAAATLLMSRSDALWLLVVAILLLRHFGQALMGHTATTAMARYFETGRGKAISISALGFPIGEAVFPIAAVGVIAVLGWRETWLAIAAFLVLVVLPAAFWLLGDHRDRQRRYLERVAREEEDVRAGRMRLAPSWTRAQVFRDPRFWLLLPGILAPAYIVTGLFFHQVHITEVKDWSLAVLAAAYTAYAAGMIAASLATGVVVDRVGAPRVLPVFLLPIIAGMAVLLAGDAQTLVWPYMALCGISSGITHTLSTSLWAEVYGTRNLGAIKSAMSALQVAASAAAPMVMGLMFDAGFSLQTVVGAMIAYALLGLVLAVLAMRGFLSHRTPRGPLAPAGPAG